MGCLTRWSDAVALFILSIHKFDVQSGLFAATSAPVFARVLSRVVCGGGSGVCGLLGFGLVGCWSVQLFGWSDLVRRGGGDMDGDSRPFVGGHGRRDVRIRFVGVQEDKALTSRHL